MKKINLQLPGFAFINHTDPPAPKYRRENQSFQREEQARERACWFQVNSRKQHSNLFWVLELVSSLKTSYLQSIAALSGSTEEDHDLQIREDCSSQWNYCWDQEHGLMHSLMRCFSGTGLHYSPFQWCQSSRNPLIHQISSLVDLEFSVPLMAHPQQ